jgi:SOS-response transcriptional repressor LexA
MFQAMSKTLQTPSWLPALSRAFKDSGLNMRQLSDISGVSYDRLNKIMRGEVERPRGTALKQIFHALDLSDQYVNEGLLPSKNVGVGQTPVRGEVAAGIWMEYDTEVQEPTAWLPFELPQFPKGSVYGLIVRGDSLNKIASDGSTLVVVDLALSGISLKDGDVAIVERRKSQESIREVTAKRVRWLDGAFWLLPVSTNPRWEAQRFHLDETSDDEELRAIARVEFVLSRPTEFV